MQRTKVLHVKVITIPPRLWKMSFPIHPLIGFGRHYLMPAMPTSRGLYSSTMDTFTIIIKSMPDSYGSYAEETDFSRTVALT